MRHDPESNATAYLGAAMSPRRAKRFESHLLECELCWEEVTQARLGRSAAEAARELAPHMLRERVRMAVEGAGGRDRWRVRLGVPGGVLALVLTVSALAFVFGWAGGPPSGRQPEAIAQAIADFRGSRLPAGTPRAHSAPDLSGLGFELVGSGGGEVGNIAVDAFDYRDGSGRRVLVYLSSRPFPTAAGAHPSAGPDGPWTAGTNEVELLCSQHPLPLLAVSDDGGALRDLASYLGVW